METKELREIQKQLCKYMNDNEENLNSEVWNRLYEAKEQMRKASEIIEITKITEKEMNK